MIFSAQSPISNQETGPFSVLMSVYKKESPVFFLEALQTTVYQTLPPREIVLVIDGPITPQLEEVIQSWKSSLKEKLNVIRMKQNSGLGVAMSVGLEACQYDIIARMDTDDICKSDRFEKQMNFLNEHPEIDVVGSWISEFEISPGDSDIIRRVPETLEQIRKMSIYRSPMNHVTTMFRKSAVLQAGNYKSFAGLEDYHLWVRMLLKGSRFYNIQESLVYVRAGVAMHLRRGGWHSLKNDYRLQRFFLKKRFINQAQFLLNVLVRAIVRFMPNIFRGCIYTSILRTKRQTS